MTLRRSLFGRIAMSDEWTTLDAAGYIGSLFRVPRILHVPSSPGAAWATFFFWTWMPMSP